MLRTAPLLVALLLAGCTQAPHDAEGLDTGDIAPNAQSSLNFDSSTTIHCHPHPWMSQNITIANDAPAEVHVHIVDGVDAQEYRYEPENVTIAKGGRVIYHNHGNFTHTATQKTDERSANAHA